MQRSVDSVAAQSFTDFECFIVDNASEDGSIKALKIPDARFSVIELPTNTGFAAGNNHAAKLSRGDWIALLNPDAFAAPDWLAQMVAVTEHPNVSMVGCLQRMALEPGILDGAGDCYHASGLAWRAKFGHKETEPLGTYEVFAPCGAAALYKAEMFHKIGGFDERFFCYHEDVDIGFRLRLAGGRCIQTSDTAVDHVSSGISGRASDFAVYYGTRNRIWTFFKNMPLPLLIVLAPAHIALNLAVLLWSLIRIKRFKPTLKGVVHGFGGLGTILKSRADIKPHKKATSMDILKQLAWSPLTVLRRDLHHGPYISNPTQDKNEAS